MTTIDDCHPIYLDELASAQPAILMTEHVDDPTSVIHRHVRSLCTKNIKPEALADLAPHGDIHLTVIHEHGGRRKVYLNSREAIKIYQYGYLVVVEVEEIKWLDRFVFNRQCEELKLLHGKTMTDLEPLERSFRDSLWEERSRSWLAMIAGLIVGRATA